MSPSHSDARYEAENGQPLNDEEARAIRRLRSLARQWPKSLTLFSAAGSLIVIRSDQEWDRHAASDRLPQDAPLAHIDGIPNDGGDPW